jgi:Cdc6-like AAA superfamily ATPase
MISYKEYEKKVYDWLITKHQSENSFTFSVRRNGVGDAKKDYFIGTEKSKYFSTTFWTMPGSYPGSSGDNIGLMFQYTKTGYNYFIEFNQTKSPHDAQNQSILALLESMRPALEEKIGLQSVTSADNKMYTLKTKTHRSSFETIEEMLEFVDKDITIVIPIVNDYLEKEKAKNKDFVANRITVPDFESMIEKMKKRFEKYNDDDESKEDFLTFLKKFDSTDLTTYFDFFKYIITTLNLKKGDERLQFSYRGKRLHFTIGQRIAWILNLSEKKGKFYVLSNDKLNESSSQYKGATPLPWGSNFNEFIISEKEKNSVIEGFKSELNRTTKSGYRTHNDEEFESYTFNYALGNTSEIKTEDPMPNYFPLNQILYGPPGTGKTFNSINEALKIVDKNYFEVHENDRTKLTDRFKELLIKNWDETKGQIAFCTFHQSFSYEDFVEGIKPKTSESKNVYYDIEAGVFKRICQLADSNNSTVKVIKEGKLSWDEDQFKKASFYKLSLGALYNPNDKPIYEYCRDNSYIAIGFGQENDFTGLSESEIVEKCEELNLEVTAAQQMNYFIHYLKKGNYVIIGNGNKYVRAIGKVIGDYEYKAESPILYNHFRKVEWIFVDENIPIEDIYERGLSQKTMYKIDETALKLDFFTNKGQQEVIEAKEDKKFVLIIDEINRGNVSSIFGELITLIEKDKRAGCDEELEVTLPYSKETFKVPSNVYLIGTMNTADRSVEALDTALRRRFSFKELMPNSEVVYKKGFTDYSRSAIMEKINNRIEVLLDRNHTLGHAYFIKPDFKHSFENEIIPLLQEYFYNDYGKIGLVLGKGFVREKSIAKTNDKSIFADFETKKEVDILKSYELIPFNEVDFDAAIQTLLA